jgi:hypothetical protein
VLVPYYVAWSDLALLEAARAHRRSGDVERADAALARFRAAWPDRESWPGFAEARFEAAN